MSTMMGNSKVMGIFLAVLLLTGEMAESFDFDPCAALEKVGSVAGAVSQVDSVIASATGYVGSWLGFGTAGVVKGSVAAGIQAGGGNVAAGSLFAKMTAIGMGAGAVPMAPAAATVAAVAATAYGVCQFLKPKSSEGDSESEL